MRGDQLLPIISASTKSWALETCHKNWWVQVVEYALASKDTVQPPLSWRTAPSDPVVRQPGWTMAKHKQEDPGAEMLLALRPAWSVQNVALLTPGFVDVLWVPCGR